jgi:hypothetical protein
LWKQSKSELLSWPFIVGLCFVSNQQGLPFQTTTKAFAFSSGAGETPCCYPGHCLDNYLGKCDYCTPGFKSIKDKRCREKKPPCDATAVQVTGTTGILKVAAMVDGTATVSCPTGFSGSVVLKCDKTSLTIAAHSCATKASAVATKQNKDCTCAAGTAAMCGLCPKAGTEFCTACLPNYVRNSKTNKCERVNSVAATSTCTVAKPAKSAMPPKKKSTKPSLLGKGYVGNTGIFLLKQLSTGYCIEADESGVKIAQCSPKTYQRWTGALFALLMLCFNTLLSSFRMLTFRMLTFRMLSSKLRFVCSDG